MFEISQGLNIDNQVNYLYGILSPATDIQTLNTPVGSIYSNTLTGAQYKRIALEGLPSDWVELASVETAKVFTGITSKTVVGSIGAKDYTSFIWELSIREDNTPANTYSGQVHLKHNGTPLTDATKVSRSISGILMFGDPIAGLSIQGDLVGVGDTQKIQLTVVATNAITCSVSQVLRGATGSLIPSTSNSTVTTAAPYSITLQTTTTEASQLLDSFLISSQSNVAKYFVKVLAGTELQASELLLVSGGGTVSIAEFGVVLTGGQLAVYTADIQEAAIQLKVTPTHAISTFYATRTLA